MKTKTTVAPFRTYLVLPVLVFILGLSACSHKPSRFKIVATKPMDSILLSSYLNIDTLYKSDRNFVVIVGWGPISESKDHNLKIEIGDTQKVFYTKTVENMTIQPNIYYRFQVRMPEIAAEDDMPDELTVSAYLDDELAASQVVKYEKKSIVNKTIQQAVVLPFTEQETAEPPQYSFSAGHMNTILNTSAHSIFCEVQRVLPNTIPHYVTEEQLAQPLAPDCFENRDCVNYLIDMFGKSVFISGSIYITRWLTRPCNLKITVFNAANGNILEYRGIWVTHANYSTGETIHGLIEDIVYRKGLQDDLQTLVSTD